MPEITSSFMFCKTLHHEEFGDFSVWRDRRGEYWFEYDFVQCFIDDGGWDNNLFILLPEEEKQEEYISSRECVCDMVSLCGLYSIYRWHHVTQWYENWSAYPRFLDWIAEETFALQKANG